MSTEIPHNDTYRQIGPAGPITGFADLSPPYSTIVVDPPWDHSDGTPSFVNGNHGSDSPGRHALPYSAMTVEEIRSLPIYEMAAANAHLYLWTTNRYLRASYTVAESWGFHPAQVLVWCKTPMGIGPGGAFAVTTEFILFGRRGSLPSKERAFTSWWNWKRGAHSAKPAAFLDVVEQISPGPYLELFARTPRLGWDHWGYGYESDIS